LVETWLVGADQEHSCRGQAEKGVAVVKATTETPGLHVVFALVMPWRERFEAKRARSLSDLLQVCDLNYVRGEDGDGQGPRWVLM
jgi:hypothetical protein